MVSFFNVYGGLFLLGLRYRDLDLYLSEYNLNTRPFLVIAAAQTHDNPPTFHEVFELPGLIYNRVKKVASQLEAMGYVELILDADDPRKQRIRLTRTQSSGVATSWKTRASWKSSSTASPPDDAKQLFMVLDKIFRN